MPDYSKLIEALRYCSVERPCFLCPRYEEGTECFAKLHRDAAAAIEALQAEQKKTVTQIFCEEQAVWEGRCKDLMKQIGELQAEVERLEPKQRKPGRWEKAKPKGVVTYSDGYAECSSCHEAIWLGWSMNFCPNCGTQNRIIDPDDMAKMGGNICEKHPELGNVPDDWFCADGEREVQE